VKPTCRQLGKGRAKTAENPPAASPQQTRTSLLGIERHKVDFKGSVVSALVLQLLLSGRPGSSLLLSLHALLLLLLLLLFEGTARDLAALFVCV